MKDKERENLFNELSKSKSYKKIAFILIGNYYNQEEITKEYRGVKKWLKGHTERHGTVAKTYNLMSRLGYLKTKKYSKEAERKGKPFFLKTAKVTINLNFFFDYCEYEKGIKFDDEEKNILSKIYFDSLNKPEIKDILNSENDYIEHIKRSIKYSISLGIFDRYTETGFYKKLFNIVFNEEDRRLLTFSFKPLVDGLDKLLVNIKNE